MINIRYAQIRECDVSNGEGVGVALFVQGCNFHCYNCFNKDTWDFNGGKEWTPKVEDKFIELASRPYIKRISILGGEPLADENLDGVLNLVNKIRLLMPEKTIWLYTGHTLSTCEYLGETIFTFNPYYYHPNPLNGKPLEVDDKSFLIKQDRKRVEIVKSIDVLVDGRYIDSQRNLSAKWKGSDNQRVIDVQKSLQQNEVILYCE